VEGESEREGGREIVVSMHLSLKAFDSPMQTTFKVVSLSLRLKDLVRPVTRVKKKKKQGCHPPKDDEFVSMHVSRKAFDAPMQTTFKVAAPPKMTSLRFFFFITLKPRVE